MARRFLRLMQKRGREYYGDLLLGCRGGTPTYDEARRDLRDALTQRWSL